MSLPGVNSSAMNTQESLEIVGAGLTLQEAEVSKKHSGQISQAASDKQAPPMTALA